MRAKITNADLAEFFISKAEGENIVSEVFSFLELDCFARLQIDPVALDKQVADFRRSDYADIHALAVVIEILRDAKHKAAEQDQELIEKAKAYVDTHYTEDFSVEKMAEDFYVSYHYLCHCFKKGVGLSVIEYRNQKRIELAVRKLLETDKKIAEIATQCGFNSISYFTEVFSKLVGDNPTAFRMSQKDLHIHDFYTLEDILLAAKMPAVSLLAETLSPVRNSDLTLTPVNVPDEEFSFLHEAAIIEYHGVLYADWYNNRKVELQGYTPICGRRSYDHGKTWTDREIIAEDKSAKILYCPPVFGICEDQLYLLLNQMTAPDHIHSMDLYVLNPQTQKFEFLWSRPIPFKLNTNVVQLPDGKLMLPGRVGELDGFPNTPAVLISDSGKIDDQWRLVKIAENGDLADGKKLVYPELSVMRDGQTLYMFCRNDQRTVPLVYLSEDYGETWSVAHTHDVPVRSSKIYCGNLSDGRKYLIASTRPGRVKLTVYFTEKNSNTFTKYLDLFEKEHTPVAGVTTCHYPCAYECEGKLYVIATVGYESGSDTTRGASLLVIDLDSLDIE